MRAPSYVPGVILYSLLFLQSSGAWAQGTLLSAGRRNPAAALAVHLPPRPWVNVLGGTSAPPQHGHHLALHGAWLISEDYLHIFN